MRTEITMKWNSISQKWLMELKGTSIFLYDFWNCGTVIRMFEKLSFHKPQSYRITIEHIGGDDADTGNRGGNSLRIGNSIHHKRVNRKDRG